MSSFPSHFMLQLAATQTPSINCSFFANLGYEPLQYKHTSFCLERQETETTQCRNITCKEIKENMAVLL